ncbi:MAG: CRISPR-associated protein Cas4 [Gammaproteobacteria bacterium]|nr:MAG: CRISPR-associated protein Cas4 [Gammaproteobacteria bacterium]
MEDTTINGTLIWYYYICPRQVWFISHSIAGEQDNQFIELGRHIHEFFYRERKKELLIDNTIKIDLIPYEGVIAEVKKSSRNLKSALMQVAFYLYYFKHKKGVELSGKLLFPKEKKQLEVKLTEELEKELETAFIEISKIVQSPNPPSPKWINFCKNCAYKPICWV